MQQLLREKPRHEFCNARVRYKEIRPAHQPIKSLVLSPYNKNEWRLPKTLNNPDEKLLGSQSHQKTENEGHNQQETSVSRTAYMRRTNVRFTYAMYSCVKCSKGQVGIPASVLEDWLEHALISYLGDG